MADLAVGDVTGYGATVTALDPALRHRADRNVAAMRADSESGWMLRLAGDLRRLAAPAEMLTPHERRILEASSFGMTAPMVAETLGVKPSTVTSHLEHVRAKLGAKNTTHAVALALRAGVIE